MLENGRRIDGMSTRLDGVEARLDRVEARRDRIEDSLDDLYRAVIDQTTTLTVAITARARQFMLQRWERW